MKTVITIDMACCKIALPHFVAFAEEFCGVVTSGHGSEVDIEFTTKTNCDLFMSCYNHCHKKPDCEDKQKN